MEGNRTERYQGAIRWKAAAVFGALAAALSISGCQSGEAMPDPVQAPSRPAGEVPAGRPEGLVETGGVLMQDNMGAPYACVDGVPYKFTLVPEVYAGSGGDAQSEMPGCEGRGTIGVDYRLDRTHEGNKYYHACGVTGKTGEVYDIIAMTYENNEIWGVMAVNLGLPDNPAPDARQAIRDACGDEYIKEG